MVFFDDQDIKVTAELESQRTGATTSPINVNENRMVNFFKRVFLIVGFATQNFDKSSVEKSACIFEFSQMKSTHLSERFKKLPGCAKVDPIAIQTLHSQILKLKLFCFEI